MKEGIDDLATINKNFLPTPDELQKWHTLKDAQGPTFAGSLSWNSYLSFLENGFRKCGLTEMKRHTITYNRWFTSNDRGTGDWALSIEDKKIRHHSSTTMMTIHQHPLEGKLWSLRYRFYLTPFLRCLTSIADLNMFRMMIHIPQTALA